MQIRDELFNREVLGIRGYAMLKLVKTLDGANAPIPGVTLRKKLGISGRRTLHRYMSTLLKYKVPVVDVRPAANVPGVYTIIDDSVDKQENKAIL